MSKEYAEDKIREALRAHGGNLTLARQQLMTWAGQDSKLLFALARPHLNGIIAYQVERVASGRAEKEKSPKSANISEQEKEENFGMDLLRAVAASGAAVFGQENNAPPVRKGAASQAHMDAIRQMAARATVKPVKTTYKDKT